MYNPIFSITPELLRLITEATELRSWIGRAVVDVSWLPVLQRETTARLAHSSTAIEGNPLSLPDVQALARGDAVGGTAQSRQEVLNVLAALRWIWSRPLGEEIVSANLLRVHKLLTQKTMPPETTGHYKMNPNRVVDGSGRTVYTPPPPEQSGPLTQELLDWVCSPKSQILHPILMGAVAHHRLVSIHPFSDGNGRVARALGVWVLHTRGFDTHHLLALDDYFEGDRQRYYDKIQQVRDLDEDLTFWMEYVAQGVVETWRQTQQRIQSLRVSRKGVQLLLTPRQEDVLRLLRDKDRQRSSDMEKVFGVTRARVGQILKPLVKAGLVLREGQTRSTTYRLAE